MAKQSAKQIRKASNVRHKKQGSSLLLERAAELAEGHPHFIKRMSPSHVSGCFWLGLPAEFCLKHLGRKDHEVVLENGSGEKFSTIYVGARTGLSGGWRRFAIKHQLHEGDVLLFQQLDLHRYHFKVHKLQPNGASKKLKQAPCEAEEDSPTVAVPTCSDPTSCYDISDGLLFIDKYGNGVDDDIDDINYEGSTESDAVEGASIVEPTVACFKDVTCLDSFKVLFNGRNISSEIPKVVLKKYYELCRSQNSYLHENVVESLGSQVVAGLISETVSIAEAIKSCRITTEESEFSTWDKTLHASEMLGMNVGFMRSRAIHLASLAAQSKKQQDARHLREIQEAERRARLADL